MQNDTAKPEKPKNVDSDGQVYLFGEVPPRKALRSSRDCDATISRYEASRGRMKWAAAKEAKAAK